MQEPLYTVVPLDPKLGTVAPGLTLTEAFARVMAIAERDFMFFRTGGWVMHLVTPQKAPGEPDFESSLSVDSHARAEIMRKVCDHGLGLFRVVPDEQFHSERISHGRAA